MSLRGDVTLVTNSSGTSPIAITHATNAFYSNSFKLTYGNAFGIWLLATSVSSTPNLKIQLEQSYTLPTTEGASDANWVIGDGVADIYSALNDEIAHIKTLAPVPMKYGRLKISGNTTPTDTLLTFYLFQQELIS